MTPAAIELKKKDLTYQIHDYIRMQLDSPFS